MIPFWSGGEQKEFHSWEVFKTAIHIAALSIFSLVEVIRLYFGHTGNLNEKVPSLAGFFLLSVFPQFPLMLYFVYLQFDVTALDRALTIVQLTFLCIEIVFGFIATKRLIGIQTSKFYLHFDSEGRLHSE
jgi:transmembrane protein 17